MYPEIEIRVKNIIKNAKLMSDIFKSNGKKLSLVTKCLVCDKIVVEKLVQNGIDIICEAHIQNLREYRDIKVEKWLIREPMPSQAEDVVRYCDVSLNSEISTLNALNDEAKKQGKTHKVILMYELGDLREGADEKELEYLATECLGMENISLYGIGVNLSCYGTVLPDSTNMEELAMVAKNLEQKLGTKLAMVSGGNSTSFVMLKNGELPQKINNLRMGESVFFGNVPCIEKPIEGFCTDNFVLRAQIVEIKDKPSVPRGNKGLSDALGEKPPVFEDKGIRKRALVAIGKQDVSLDGLTPLDEEITILGGSSDYTILDITDSKKCYKVGDVVEFSPSYGSLLRLMGSNYVNRVYK